MKAIITATAAIGLLATTAAADPLPEGAKPIGPASLTKLYSGRTLDWDTSMAYFAPDGTVKGINTQTGDSIFWGNWTVKGNEVCMVNNWKSLGTGETGSGATDCWKWWVAGEKEYWTLWSVRYDGSQPPADDYYDGELKKFRKGDAVSRKFDRLNS